MAAAAFVVMRFGCGHFYDNLLKFCTTSESAKLIPTSLSPASHPPLAVVNVAAANEETSLMNLNPSPLCPAPNLGEFSS